MQVFIDRLQERISELGLSQAEAARLSGLNERRFNHYARGRRQPDLDTLVRIAATLKTTPNWLLGVETADAGVGRRALETKLAEMCQTLDAEKLGIAVTLVTALAQHESTKLKPKAKRQADA